MRSELEASVRQRGFPPEHFRAVRLTQYAAILASILTTFTTQRADRPPERWLWTVLKGHLDSHQLTPEDQSADPPVWLHSLVEPESAVWLVLEDWTGTKRQEPFWVFEGTARAAAAAVAEVPFCEYYVVHRRFSWLLCENHHGVLITTAGLPLSL